MDGILTGMDLIQALASIPAGLDREFARELFVTAEIAFVAAHLSKKA